MTDATRIEETLAHLVRVVDDLSEVIARQDAEIAVLNRRVEMLWSREADRMAEGSAAAPLADQKPPHW